MGMHAVNNFSRKCSQIMSKQCAQSVFNIRYKFSCDYHLQNNSHQSINNSRINRKMFLFILWTFFCAVICMNAWWNSTYWIRQGVHGPRGFPLIGNMLHYLSGCQHYGNVYEEIYQAYPELPYIGIYRVFNEPVILLRSQDLIKDILIRNFHSFEDNVLWVDPKRDPIISYNPFIAKGRQWRDMRAELVPIFTPNKVKSSFPHIAMVCEKLDAYVAANLHNDCFELKELFSKYTLDVVASAAYGLDGESFSNSNSDFTKLMENLFLPNSWSLLETTALLFSPTLGSLTQYCYVPQKVQLWLRTIIGKVLEKRLKSKQIEVKHSDFIQWLIENKEKLGEDINAETIVGHCSTFLVEGFETSSSLMAFALYLYAVNPDIQKRVLNEIDAVLERFNNVLCFEALQDMPYLEASLYETLRLYPPMMALLKHCTAPFTLPPQTLNGKPFTVPKNMVFVVPVRAIHRDPELYSQPDEFQPERFINQNQRQRMGCVFLGFGEGPRMCPGMRFGMAMSKAGLVTLLRQYSVELGRKAKEPLQLAPTTFLTAAKDGIWISFRPRK